MCVCMYTRVYEHLVSLENKMTYHMTDQQGFCVRVFRRLWKAKTLLMQAKMCSQTIFILLLTCVY